MRDGTNGLRGGFGDCEMSSNFCQCGEFVYMSGSQLWDCGEDGDGGFWVEPVQGEDVLKQCVNCCVGLEGDYGFMVGSRCVIDEGGKVVKVKRNLDSIRVSLWEKMLIL